MALIGDAFVHAALTLAELPGRGIGVVSSASLEPGTIILRERAAAFVAPSSVAPSGSNSVAVLLAERLVVSLKDNTELHAEVAALEGYGHTVTGNAELDAFVAASSVCLHNAYSIGTDCASAGEGLWVFGSRFNHACAPNVSWHVSDGDMLVMRVSRHVSGGSELCISYGPGDDYDPFARAATLRSTWGFECDDSCLLCREQRLAARALTTARESGDLAYDSAHGWAIPPMPEALRIRMRRGSAGAGAELRKALASARTALDAVGAADDGGLALRFAASHLFANAAFFAERRKSFDSAQQLWTACAACGIAEDAELAAAGLAARASDGKCPGPSE